MDWEYIVVERYDLIDLVAEVNRRIERGFRPLGGISTSRDNGYMQAMIKEKEDGRT